MNQIFLRLFAIALFSCITAFTIYSQSSEKTDSPTAKESLKTLFKNGNLQLASIASCKSETTEAGDKTIFDYLSAIIANQAEPKTKTSLEYSADEESGDPWNVGFRFLMEMQNRQMVRGSLECIGN